MKTTIKLLFLIFTLIVSTNLYSGKPWSHTTWEKDGGSRNPDAFITKWIVADKPVRYCLFIEEGAKITKESASIQVRAAIKNWLKSISFYDKNNKVYRSDSVAVINTSKVSIEELNCRLVPDSDNTYYVSQGKDKEGKVVPKLEYFSVFFSLSKGLSGYFQVSGAGRKFKEFKEVNVVKSRSKYYEYYANLYHVDVPTLQKIIRNKVELDRYSKLFKTTPPKIMMIEDAVAFDNFQPCIWMYMGSEQDLLDYVKKENKQNFETIITDGIYIKIENMMQSDQNYIYSFDEFCKEKGINCATTSHSSFDTLIHELGHAFGLGDEHTGGLQSYNDRNYMSALIKPSVMKSEGAFFPTKDDVVGLTYLFDRIAGRDINQRKFKFESYPESNYAHEFKDVAISQNRWNDKEDTYKIITSGTRDNQIRDIEIGKNAENFLFSGVTYEDLEKRIIPKLIEYNKGKALNKYGNRTRAVISIRIANTNLTALPPKITELTELKHLDLDGNKLTRVPLEVTKLKNLQTLNLSNNELTSLPSEIVNLKQLRELNISYNRFISLTPEVGELSSLWTINLLNNPFKSLPVEMENIKKLVNVDVSVDTLDQKSKDLVKRINNR